MIASGDLFNISCDQDEVGGFTYGFKSTEDAPTDKGGWEISDDKNSITSAGERIAVYNRIAGELELVVGATVGAYEKTKEYVNSRLEGTWTVAYPDGSIRAGKGQPVGEIKLNPGTGTISFKVQFSGQFEEI